MKHYDEDDIEYDDRNDDRDDMSASDRAYSDRLDYATECRERDDWRDPGEIRMGA